jgi:hypothetical protein
LGYRRGDVEDPRANASKRGVEKGAAGDVHVGV